MLKGRCNEPRPEPSLVLFVFMYYLVFVCFVFLKLESMELKVPYCEKHIFSGLYIYKLVLSEPTNCQSVESKQVLHCLWSPPTGKTGLLYAVQIQFLLLLNNRRDFHRPASSAQKHSPLSPEISERAAFTPSSKIAVFRNVVAQS